MFWMASCSYVIYFEVKKGTVIAKPPRIVGGELLKKLGLCLCKQLVSAWIEFHHFVTLSKYLPQVTLWEFQQEWLLPLTILEGSHISFKLPRMPSRPSDRIFLSTNMVYWMWSVIWQHGIWHQLSTIPVSNRTIFNPLNKALPLTSVPYKSWAL